jgi:glycosyltransferase involved in cell wall biosynthesis
VILFVGRLAETKGVTYLLRAMAMEPLRSTAASLAIVGYGPLRDELEEEADRLGIADRVRFLGAMDHHQLPTVYASADVFCAPSVLAEGGDRESFGVVLCEAGASGLASVTTRVGGASPVVRDGETGMLVAEKDSRALAETLAELIADEKRCTAYGGNARDRVREFGWSNVCGQYAGLINGLLAN